MATIKEQNFISAVVYVRNSEILVDRFLQQLGQTLFENFSRYEIICVNDASDDGSVDAIKKVAATLQGCMLSLINMSFFHGLENAMNAGVDLAIGDFVFEFDHMFIDYELSLVMDIYHQSLKGFDIVTASNSTSKFTSKMFYALFNMSTRTAGRLSTETFRVVSRRAINRIHSMSKTIPYRKALYATCGLKTESVIYKPLRTQRLADTTLFRRNKTETAITSFILFTDIAYKLALIMTSVMMLATLGGAIYAVVVFLIKKPVPGYTTTLLVMTGSFFGVFSILAVIIKYLSTLVDLVFIRQKYLIEDIEKVKGM